MVARLFESLATITKPERCEYFLGRDADVFQYHPLLCCCENIISAYKSPIRWHGKKLVSNVNMLK